MAVWLKRFFKVQRRLAESRDGIRLWVDPISHLGREILDTGVYESDMGDILRSLLREGDTFVDVGVNEGYFSCLASRIVGSEGKVMGVEPQTRLTPIISKNFATNSVCNADIENAALSDRNGTQEIFLAPNTNSGASGFISSTRWSQPKQMVRTVTLDSWLAQKRVHRVRFMKVDCEGAEEAILEGAHATLAAQALDFLMIEFHPHLTGGSAPARIDHLLRNAGYRLSQIANGGWIYHLPELQDTLIPLGPYLPVAPQAFFTP